eukprot:1177146-Prorocentrum_minimum.AAC.1
MGDDDDLVAHHDDLVRALPPRAQSIRHLRPYLTNSHHATLVCISLTNFMQYVLMYLCNPSLL